MLKPLISFLKDCYQADNREFTLYNIHSTKIENLRELSDSHLLTGKNPILPIESGYIREVKEKLVVYSKEKELVMHTFFLHGMGKIAGKLRKVFAPLLIYPLHIEENNDHFYVKLNPDNFIINSSILHLLENEENEIHQVKQEIYKIILDNQYLNFSACSAIKNLLEEKFHNIDASNLLLYPEVITENEITTPVKNKFSCHPSVMISLLGKSASSLGVMAELEELSEKNVYSNPLTYYLGQSTQDKNLKDQEINVPVILNNAQKKVFKSVFKNTATLVIGPPGTGKSFSIASLAVDQLSKGRSVLIVAATHQAVNVIADKIEQDFNLENVLVRAGANRDHKKFLQERIRNILMKVGIGETDLWELKSNKYELKLVQKHIRSIEKSIVQKELWELKVGQLLATERTFFQNLLLKLLIIIKNKQHYWTLLNSLENYLSQRNQIVKDLVQNSYFFNVLSLLQNNRRQLTQFSNAVKARTGARKERIFDTIDFEKLKLAFPVWLVTVNDIHAILPLKKDLFDLLIIDEATQCDISSILPVLYRSKRVVVSGDPKQLRHISFISLSQQYLLGKKSSIDENLIDWFDYRNKSFLDLINERIENPEQTILLNEHFRSLPDIIQFCNQYFYQNSLQIMTESPFNNIQRNIVAVNVKGSRSKAGYNKDEADVIFDKIREIVTREADLEASICQTIGILSPIRDQVDYLKKRILKEITLPQIERHSILIGTTYSFQGEERDIMFISLVADKHSHPATLNFINRPDVFNVTVSRARVYQYLIYSFDHSNIKPESLLRKYFEHIQKELTASLKLKNTDDAFLLEVIEELKSWGIKDYHCAYTVAGLMLDIVFSYNEKTYCIDLIGYPGAFSHSFSLERYKILNRVGIAPFPLTYSDWKLNKLKAIEALKSFLKYNYKIT